MMKEKKRLDLFSLYSIFGHHNSGSGSGSGIRRLLLVGARPSPLPDGLLGIG
jgi:hypothetical protein